MGFVDLNGQSGRRFGSLGLSLNLPRTTLSLAVGECVFGEARLPAYAEQSLQKILNALHIQATISVHIQEAIPRHFGLGSGTQMALAIGMGISELFGLKITPSDIATITNRGGRSGVGIGTFEHGGLVVDAGRGASTRLPPIIARHAFPLDWRVLLIMDNTHQGIHGEQETNAFKTLPNMRYADTLQNSYNVLMQALPALLEHDLTAFGQAISQLQFYTGHYFSATQEGLYASQAVASVLQYLHAHGVNAIGQTSWGPTGFAILESETEALGWIAKLSAEMPDAGLKFLLCQANNQGAQIHAIA